MKRKIHPLKAYLDRPDAKDLAKLMAVTPLTLWRWCNGKTSIRLEKALRLERLTGGAVKPSDFALK